MSWFSPYRGLEQAFNIFCVQGYEDVLMVVAAFRIVQDIHVVGDLGTVDDLFVCLRATNDGVMAHHN